MIRPWSAALALAIGTGCVAPTGDARLRPALQTAFDAMQELAATLSAADKATAQDLDSTMRRAQELARRMESFAFLLEESDRPALRAFAERPTTRQLRFPMAQLLLYAGEYPLAVDYLLPLLATTPNPRYAMWKLFEELFGAEPDYELRSKQIGRAFLVRYDTHPEDQALIRRLFSDDIAGLRQHLRDFTATDATIRAQARTNPPWTGARLTAHLDRGGIRATGRLVRFREISDWDYGTDLDRVPPAVRLLAGQTVTMAGFPAPDTGAGSHRQFGLCRSPGYSGHQDPGPHEVVWVIAPAPVQVRPGQPLRVTGTFRIARTRQDGYTVAVFRIEDARVTPIE